MIDHHHDKFTGLSREVDHPLGADINLGEDAFLLVLMLCAMASLHFGLQRMVFLPLARLIVRRPRAVVAAALAEQQRLKDPGSQDRPVGIATPPPSPDLSLKRQLKIQKTIQDYQITVLKCATSAYKFLAYMSLFLLGAYALYADNQMAAGSEGDWFKDGWFRRGLWQSFDQYPFTRIRFTPAQYPLQDGYVLQRVNFVINYLTSLGGGSYLQGTVIPLLKSTFDSLLASSPVLFHFHFALAFYIYSTILLAFNIEGPKQKDKYEMISHHLITTFLICFAWYAKLHHIGVMILVLHDVSDPIMELAKMSLYAGRQNQANAFFATFAIVFLLSRCVLFPTFIVWPCFTYLFSTYGSSKAAVLLPSYPLGIASLLGLQVLHVFWGSLIVKMIVEALTKGNVGDDIRDEE